MFGWTLTASQARRLATEALEEVAFDQDFLTENLAAVGEPVLVRTVHGLPSYWTVPLHGPGGVVGFVRVMNDGAVGAVGRFGGAGSPVHYLPTVTGIDASEATRRAEEILTQAEELTKPMFVHDGPPGREAWLVATSAAGRPSRWIFVTPAFVYARPAGEELDPELE